ncbi:MAG TPA: A24 family peptidase [Opitutaceae bacterium]|nr:A24 family peptidase [Opitutaceae bacterium]
MAPTVSALFDLPAAAASLAAGAFGGRGLARLNLRLAAAEGLPASRYYPLAGRSRWAALPLLGHFLRPRGTRCPRLFALEAGGALALLLCWAALPPLPALCGAVFLLALLGASFIDLDHLIIPDLFSVGLAAAGLALSALVPALHGQGMGGAVAGARSVAAAALGLAVGSALLLWFSLFVEMLLGREVLGFGDVKLAGAIGAFCGWQGALFSIFGGALLGALVIAAAAGLRLAGGGNAVQLFRAPGSAERTGRVGWGTHFPFGPMLASAAALYFLALHPAVDAYLQRYLALFS